MIGKRYIYGLLDRFISIGKITLVLVLLLIVFLVLIYAVMKEKHGSRGLRRW